MASLSTLIILFVSLGSISTQEMYSDKYDNINVDLILKSDRLFKRYMACILDKGPCSPDGRFFRTVLPDALATDCSKCTTKMRINVRKVAKYVKNQRPQEWAEFVQKYDPDHKHEQLFEHFTNE